MSRPTPPQPRAHLLISASLSACLPPSRAYDSVDRLVSVSYLDAARELWAPRLVKKRHGGAVLALAWHPSGAVLATAAADGRLRLLNALIPGGLG